ncbi:hypothetical protein AB0M29_18060 [Streptomyces sp. NPDC051976]|uniref:hypothetical protein n=1 Tax=Streptomyces sp. NPDC051976 TaxID=3154947 RepID=UPI0034225E9E
MSTRSIARRVAAAVGSAAAIAALVTLPAGSAHAASCSNPVQLGPSTKLSISDNWGHNATIGYLYIGWYANCASAYAEIDWSGGWQNSVDGSVYLNWNDPAHNSAEGRVYFHPGGPISAKSDNLYEGPGTKYTPGRSFTAATQITVATGNGKVCGPRILVGSTHDFSGGGDSGPGNGNCSV